MVLHCLSALSPGRFITKFVSWYLNIDEQTAQRIKAGDVPLLLADGEHAARPGARGAGAETATPSGAPLATQHPQANGPAPTNHDDLGHYNLTAAGNGSNYIHGTADSTHLREEWCKVAVDQIFSWEFNVFEHYASTQGHPLVTVTISLLEKYQLLDHWKVDRKRAERYLLRVEAEYRPNAYHNNTHAADVTQTAAIILESFKQHVDVLTKEEVFSVIIASAVHDLGHLGVNNDFLINSKHHRATVYNDKAVNEMYHISRAFEIARESEETDIFFGFNVEEQRRIRKLMIDMVLATDMAIHFDLLRNFNSQIGARPDVRDWTDRSLLFQMAVHLADIANPSRPFHLARGWAERVIQEFCEQGDKEATLGLPVSPFCNRPTINMPRAQLGFINVFLKPTLESFERAAPEFVHMAQRQLEHTIEQWHALEVAGLTLPEHLLLPPEDQQ